MSLRTMRQYPTLAPAPTRGMMPPMVSVIIPLARTNLITNPSFETNTTGWASAVGSATIARSAAQQYHGTYSLATSWTLASASTYYDIALTSGTTYAFSVKFFAPVANVTYKLSIDIVGVDQAVYTFKSTGRWQWVWLIYKATSTTTYQLHVDLVDVVISGTYYIDGAQLEAISDGVLAPTTYIDGDQLGLLVGQQPPAYLWTGTPHASTSTRSALTRAGGYLVNLSLYNFLLTGLIGLGMAVPNNISVPYTVLDGARYIRTTKPPRTFTLVGRWQSDDVTAQYLAASDMRGAFDRDLVPIQQPLVLIVEPQDECEQTIGDFAQIPCIYAGGLEGNDGNVPVEDVAPTFTMYVPYLVGGDAGASLTVQQSVSNANGIAQRSTVGTWSAMGTGMTGAGVYALALGLDGTIYAGGSFSDMGGSGADNLAKWNGSTWAVVRAAAALNNDVNALAVGPDGRIYVGGVFTNADGIAAGDFIAVYDPVANTYAALGTGMNNTVKALAFDGSGNLYAGGSFTLAGGVANTVRIAKWNGSAWSALSTGANADVNALAFDSAGNLYAAGAFTTIGGVAANYVAKWNGSAWSALGTGMDSTVRALALDAAGNLYAGGIFTTAGGVAAQFIAKWNGSAWFNIGDAGGTLYSLARGPNGTIYAGGVFTTIGDITTVDGIAYWNGSTWIDADIDLPGGPNVQAFLLHPNGSFYTGFSTTGTATSAAITSVTNSAPGLVYPRLVINGPATGTSRIYQIINYTTGVGIWLNLTLSAGEVATLDFNPQNPSYTTTFQGDITSKILPGSQPSLFYLAPGANSISFFAASSTVTATPSWQKRYNGVADLVN